MLPEDASFFQPNEPYSVMGIRIPHWDQPGTMAFLTFRLKDSLPREAASRWRKQRDMLLRENGIDPRKWDAAIRLRKATRRQDPVRELMRHLKPRAAALLQWQLFQTWDAELDGSHGGCVLRDRRAQKIIVEGLLKFDKDRYVVAAFVLMPNHVHVLAAFKEEGAVKLQGAAWRQYFAREINAALTRSGHLWQPEQFDHLVRSPEAFVQLRRYIIDNPEKARLKGRQYRLYVSADW